ncbi:helix-turn-helix domain-containing protein [Shewanella hanedai]|uniref:Helix-turn-helix domain-containing protein n=2 Tax=Shewanella hanedai TaxID=25 RepID=A0A553JQM2_SHEHA|nr:helix-turn-helix domain-containing protein [Shewanella hanedai]
MPIFQQYLFVIGSFQGLLMAALLVMGSQVTNASRILGLWCLFLSLSFLGYFIFMDGEVNIFSCLIGWSMFLPASYGAFLYLYCRHAIIERPLQLKDLWHFSPLLICYLLNYEILFASPEDKLNMFLTHPPEPITLVISEFILFLQAFIYIGFSAVLIRKYQIKARKTLSNFNPDIFQWLWKLLILDAVIWSLKGASSIVGFNFTLSTMGDILIIVLIYSIAMAQWRNPRLFKIDQIEDKPNPKLNNQDNTVETDEIPTSPSTAKSDGALDESTRNSLLSLVRQKMQDSSLFMDNQLTLARLAEAVGVSTHHLSEVLNQQDGKNFYRFVNEYRVNFVCTRLKEDPSIKILELALLSGFSSKSTFNAVFKQLTDQTPTQFRDGLKSTR